MQDNSKLVNAFKRFFTSFKGFITVCFIFAFSFYMLVYVINMPSITENEKTYLALKEVAYIMAEKESTDYDLSESLTSYKIVANEDGTKIVTLIGKNNINFKFFLSEDYKINEITKSYKFASDTTYFTHIISALLVGISFGAIIYFTLALVEFFFDRIERKNK